MMRKIVFALLVFSGLIACQTNDNKTESAGTTPVVSAEETAKPAEDSTQLTTIEWLDPVTKDLGKLKKDKEIEITYRFRNSGDKMLVIEDVTAGCGCTIPEKPKEPYAPGEEGIIRAKFNGSGNGAISKHITVIANTKPGKQHSLTFTGDIKE